MKKTSSLTVLASASSAIGIKSTSIFFSTVKNFVYCADIAQLLLKLGVPKYEPRNWRLFIDTSKQSLKCVLLHNGNQFASVPIAHLTTLKEKYEVVKYVLEKIVYDQHKWFICVDLKIVNFLLGQQTSFMVIMLMTSRNFVFIFIVIFATFRPMHPSAFFKRFISNLGVYMELRTELLFNP